MDQRRLKLHAILEDLMRECNLEPHVYFEPPQSVKMIYPCIRYMRAHGKTSHADNNPYTYTQGYQLTIIDRSSDSVMIRKMAMALPGIVYNRHYVADGLNHDVFSAYF